MSIRFTILPCRLKIRLHDSNLELRGDWGVPENDEDRNKDITARRARMSIDDSSGNLEALAAFFTKEAAKMRKEEEAD